MTPESFAEHFHIFADAPNGVQKLREMILQLAVRGKLVPQHTGDEPASVLLKRIRIEEKKLVKESKIKSSKTLSAITPDEAPYRLPDGWEWVRLVEVTDVLDHMRQPVSKKERETRIAGKPSEDLFPYYGATQQAGWIDDYIFDEELVLLGEDGAPFLEPGRPKAYIISGKSWVNNHAHVLRGRGILNSYLAVCLNTTDYRSLVTGTTRLKLNRSKMLSIGIPLAPLAEQKRITAKVDQLMALCDELEVRKSTCGEERITLNGACLNALTSSDADTARNGWGRISNNFELLYDSPETVSTLRQSILQLAVMGRLVPQNPNDEPASALLKKIKMEREKLIKQGKIKKPKPLSPIKPNEVPYELPRAWEWVRLGALSSRIHYGYTAPGIAAKRGVRLLRITDIQNDRVNWDTVPTCRIEEGRIRDYGLCNGDVLIARTGGTIGKSYLVNGLAVRAVFASYLIRVVPSKGLYPAYLKHFLGSELYWRQLHGSSMGTGQPNVNGTALRFLLVPLPPIAEQKRIVDKANQLMALCDELEARLARSRSTAESLLATVVHRLSAA